MKNACLLLILPLASINLFAAIAQADNTIEIDGHSFAAIAYSPATGKYGYAYNYRSRSSAEKAALAKCDAEDARIACWVNRGFCALALGDDKTYWGVGWQYGGGSSNTDAKETALEECKKRTTGAHIAVSLCSDGQYIWDVKDHTTVIDSHGNVYRGDQVVTPTPAASATSSPISLGRDTVTPPPKINKTDN